jgi:hypothetical protein
MISNTGGDDANNSSRGVVVVGRGTATRTYGGIVRPMLKRASAIGGFDALFTKQHGHAAERMRNVAVCATLSSTAGTAGASAGAGAGARATINDAEGGVRAMDVSKYHGILALGGDGILSKILQGIHRRECASSSTAGAAGASAGVGAGVGVTINDADGGVQTMDVSEYDGILALGGDGILSNILQGSDGDADGGGQW